MGRQFRMRPNALFWGACWAVLLLGGTHSLPIDADLDGRINDVARDIGEDASAKKSLDALAKDLLASDAQQQQIDAGLKKQAKQLDHLPSKVAHDRAERKEKPKAVKWAREQKAKMDPLLHKP